MFAQHCYRSSTSTWKAKKIFSFSCLSSSYDPRSYVLSCRCNVRRGRRCSSVVFPWICRQSLNLSTFSNCVDWFVFRWYCHEGRDIFLLISSAWVWQSKKGILMWRMARISKWQLLEKDWTWSWMRCDAKKGNYYLQLKTPTTTCIFFRHRHSYTPRITRFSIAVNIYVDHITEIQFSTHGTERDTDIFLYGSSLHRVLLLGDFGLGTY